MNRRPVLPVIILLVTSGTATCLRAESSDTRAGAAQPASKSIPSGTMVAERIDQIIEEAIANGEIDAAANAANRLFDNVIVSARRKDTQAFVNAAFARRLLNQLTQAASETQLPLLQFLHDNDETARMLVFCFTQQDDGGNVYQLLNRLRIERGEQVSQFSALAAAICLVHQQPLRRRINENEIETPDPIEIFDYFVENERRMFFGISKVPVELLCYVVDTTASITEMKWALSRYGGDGEVGKRFFEIKYDYDHFRQGRPKRLTEEGFSLPNIQEFGGVCADQAYFASSVGKAIGIPTAYAWGRSAEVGHAWVGYLLTRGKRGFWDFSAGRYPSYQGVQGVTINPQTRQLIPDSVVSLQAELIGRPAKDRHSAAALTDAASRLIELAGTEPDDLAALPLGSNNDAATVKPRRSAPGRLRHPDGALDLLETGLRNCPGYAPGWVVVRDLAADDELSLKQKKFFSEVLLKLCGKHYPDFAWEVLEPMIKTVDDEKEQDVLWSKTFNVFSHRFDLAARVRMAQGQMWEDAGEVKKAGRCYHDVITRYANAGPFVIEALNKTGTMLEAANQADRVAKLYQETWSSIHPPKQMASPFRTQSNWYRVGMLYLDRLEATDQPKHAEVVRKKIAKTMGFAPKSR